ncbi:hypothetical protein MOO46_07310 (plasmid) [Apilactobacillus apisilvae]|uniref:IraD/Gp25-like domain-containing protein n=1 Tax=Apilactobacillus apisilvae TaxID=2923364 RepID=A0ABY4PJP7_9LACO|nr:hypothetical protein [Apilactobacillus apisilvae]UQS85792.1 hypothetical protein MOO46_07310 [Apilactobacillus apisilvae]
MKDLMLDDSGDMIIDDVSGDLNMTDGKDELNQHVYSLLNTFLGELSWNEERGLNQMQLINSSDDLQAVQTTLSDYLREKLNDFDSIEINNSEINDRNLNIKATVKLNDGTSIETAVGGDNDAS